MRGTKQKFYNAATDVVGVFDASIVISADVSPTSSFIVGPVNGGCFSEISVFEPSALPVSV